MRPGDPNQGVAEILQADVMRFMAIIAFCLIAILALVRSVTPVEPAPSPPAPAARPPEASLPQGAEPVPQPARPEALPPVESRPPVEALPPVESPPEPPKTLAAKAPEPQPAAPDEPQPAVSPAPPADEEGLSLRFASEQDFLRLVNRGRIRVFAFNGRQVLALGDDFRFAPAAAPGEVHELLPETIPELMAGALTSSHGSGYRWGIAMPEAMARQVRDFLERGVTGELVIDRFGEVRHHDA